MTTTRPKRVTRHATPAPPVEDDATVVRTTLDRIIYTVDVMARFDQTRADIVAVNQGETEKTMAQVMAEVRWHEHASKARKECPLGSSRKKRHYEEEEEDEEEEDGQDVPSTSKPPKSAKPTPEKKSTPSKAKLAAMKKKADAARRKAQRDAKKLAELGEKDGDEEEEEMPRLEKSTISPPIGLSPDPHFPHSQNPFFFGEPVDILTLKPWLADPQTLYPLDLVPIEEDVPGRVWCPPRGLCQATAEQVCEIGPLTELETLDLTLCPEAFTHLVPEKADMIIRRMLELQIPYLEMKMLNPEMTDEDREMNIKQLEVYEKQLDENHDKPALLRMRILNLPGPPIQRIPSYRESIEYYSELDPTWYSSSRVWFDKAIRKSGKVTQQDFLDQFEETDDQMILDFQREMLAKAKEAEEQQAADKIKNFKMPLVHSIENMTPVVQERMLAFRDKLAHIFQYEDFEEIHMSDPSCRGIWKKLQPLPYEHGVQADEAEEELIALISAFKIQFAEENPIIPLPEAYDDENETPSEIEAATKRFLSDVIDTVVLREVTDIATFPHRIPIYKPHSPRTRPSSLIASESNSRSSSSERRSSSPAPSD